MQTQTGGKGVTSATDTAADDPRPARTVRVVGEPVADPTPETRRLYAGDWTHFSAWCRQQAVTPLPATPAVLLAYLLALAPHVGRLTLGRRRAAIAARHRGHGHPVPRLDAAHRAILRQAARPRLPSRPARHPTTAALTGMAIAAPRDLAGLRDRAMLLLLAAATSAGPVPRAALLGLDAEHVHFTPRGAELRLRLRADAAEPTLRLPLARSATSSACAVRALEDWLRASDAAFGPVFRKVDRWGNAEHARLGPDAWRRILARHG